MGFQGTLCLKCLDEGSRAARHGQRQPLPPRASGFIRTFRRNPAKIPCFPSFFLPHLPKSCYTSFRFVNFLPEDDIYGSCPGAVPGHLCGPAHRWRGKSCHGLISFPSSLSSYGSFRFCGGSHFLSLRFPHPVLQSFPYAGIVKELCNIS